MKSTHFTIDTKQLDKKFKNASRSIFKLLMSKSVKQIEPSNQKDGSHSSGGYTSKKTR